MKKVTAFVGSAGKKNTYKATVQFLENLQALGDVEYEIVILSDYKLGICRGCRQCFEKGEEFCPLKDDRDVLMDKIMASDGVVFATPNYSFQLSGMMKIFLDRFGFAFHRPRYFGKVFTSIVTQGFHGGGEIIKYLDFFATYLGFNPVKGACVTMLRSGVGEGATEDRQGSGSSEQAVLRRAGKTGLSCADLGQAHDLQDGPDQYAADAG